MGVPDEGSERPCLGSRNLQGDMKGGGEHAAQLSPGKGRGEGDGEGWGRAGKVAGSPGPQGQAGDWQGKTGF